VHVHLRHATDDDVEDIAALHADSWRRHYRGAYSDAFLDDEVDEDRRTVWAERFRTRTADELTILATEDERLIGFAHTILEADGDHGALVDNLHVVHDRKGRGIGTRLLAATAREVVDRRPARPIHLWVLEQNTAAQAFYRARGAAFADTKHVEPTGGGPPVAAIRCLWTDPRRLLEP
jgi:GNAT superfamily N-acetyltransferase